MEMDFAEKEFLIFLEEMKKGIIECSGEEASRSVLAHINKCIRVVEYLGKAKTELDKEIKKVTQEAEILFEDEIAKQMMH